VTAPCLPVSAYTRAISMADLSEGRCKVSATMSGVLDLTDSRARIAEAKGQYGELRGVFSGWMESGGISVRSGRHPQFAMYIWEVAVTTEPAKNLPLMTGQIINNIRSALEYVAFQVFLVAGGTPDGKLADKVAFPIVNTPDPWDSVVKKKVPGVWPEAAELMRPPTLRAHSSRIGFIASGD
jgi:hypothetical protein